MSNPPWGREQASHPRNPPAPQTPAAQRRDPPSQRLEGHHQHHGAWEVDDDDLHMDDLSATPSSTRGGQDSATSAWSRSTFQTTPGSHSQSHHASYAMALVHSRSPVPSSSPSPALGGPPVGPRSPYTVSSPIHLYHVPSASQIVPWGGGYDVQRSPSGHSNALSSSAGHSNSWVSGSPSSGSDSRALSLSPTPDDRSIAWLALPLSPTVQNFRLGIDQALTLASLPPLLDYTFGAFRGDIPLIRCSENSGSIKWLNYLKTRHTGTSMGLQLVGYRVKDGRTQVLISVTFKRTQNNLRIMNACVKIETDLHSPRRTWPPSGPVYGIGAATQEHIVRSRGWSLDGGVNAHGYVTLNTSLSGSTTTDTTTQGQRTVQSSMSDGCMRFDFLEAPPGIGHKPGVVDCLLVGGEFDGVPPKLKITTSYKYSGGRMSHDVGPSVKVYDVNQLGLPSGQAQASTSAVARA